jgi:hypothetical protein
MVAGAISLPLGLLTKIASRFVKYVRLLGAEAHLPDSFSRINIRNLQSQSYPSIILFGSSIAMARGLVPIIGFEPIS